jgi:hypothetical protein
MIELDYNTWFTQRLLNAKPVHFVKANAPVTHKSMVWIYENLNGRFYVENPTRVEYDSSLPLHTPTVSFEDPGEAMFYDLRWS